MAAGSAGRKRAALALDPRSRVRSRGFSSGRGAHRSRDHRPHQNGGFQHSQVMDVLFQLTDVHGPRLHGSENYDKAATWSRDQLLEWGLDSAEIETWPSPVPGWSLSEFGIELLEPFAYLGASTLTTENTSGTDHLLFDAAGLPASSSSRIRSSTARSPTTRTWTSTTTCWRRI